MSASASVAARRLAAAALAAGVLVSVAALPATAADHARPSRPAADGGAAAQTVVVEGVGVAGIHTGEGRDTRTDLYQDRRAYVWNNDHDTATLRNDHGRFVDDESWGHRRNGHH
ncbi:hypothetical protein [Streptomyces sp. Root1310]|uniref:hypothetical protein n=1 Tax=Streptomyces sp. Root1310 TaxID=1736452 RepID=UPI0007C855CF|nr:hypothetical protein [Streptomyces sp. Root1310]